MTQTPEVTADQTPLIGSEEGTGVPGLGDIGSEEGTGVPGLGDILSFSLPLMLGLLTTALNTFVDTLFIGQLGTAPLAAIPLAGLIYLVGYVLVLGVMRNAVAFCARAFGAGLPHEIGRIVGQYHWLALAGFPLVLLYVQAWPFFAWLGGLSTEVAAFGGAYLNIRVWDVLFAQLVALYGALYQSTGNSRLPMLVNVGVVSANIVLDYALIFGHFGLPALGVEGSALATVIAQGLGTALILAIAFGGPMRRRFALRPMPRPDRWLLARLLRIGLPQGIGDAVELIAWSGFMLIVGRLGEKELAAGNIGIQVSHLLFLPGFAFGLAAASYVGRLLGAGRPEFARITARRIIRLGVGYMALVGAPLWFFGEAIAALFTGDLQVIFMAGIMFKLMAVYQAIDGLGFITRTALTGSGDTLVPTLLSGASAVLVLYPASWVLGHMVDPPILGVWLGALAYLVIYAILMHLRFRSERWLNIPLSTTP